MVGEGLGGLWVQLNEKEKKEGKRQTMLQSILVPKNPKEIVCY